MGTIPGFMLRHRVAVEPYLGVWGLYGARVDGLPCAVAESLNAALGQPGAPRIVVRTIVAPLTWQVTPVPGSRLTLPDGLVGFVSAVARHTAPGLPVPEHWELAVDVAAAVLPPALGGELVVILRRVLSGQDRYQNATYTTEEVEVPGAAVRRLASTERTGSSMGAGRDQTIDTIEVTLPPGTEVGSNDRVRARGLVWEVDGTPIEQIDSMTGVVGGTKVIGKRVKG